MSDDPSSQPLPSTGAWAGAQWPFVVGKRYHRRQEIHARYAGQQQGGISTPAAAPGIFLFTGHGADRVGYADVFGDDGSLDFTGEGQTGDMTFVRGNGAILSHAENGKDLLVFSKPESRAKVEFKGLFACAGWRYQQQPDTTGAFRQAIVFRLEPVPPDEVGTHTTVTIAPPGDLEELRKQAILAATVQRTTSSRVTSVFARSQVIRSYALSRAAGACEKCGSAAPFFLPNGNPFLEVHHIEKLSDGGPDHPDHVAAICPNCPREAHFGANRDEIRALLMRLRRAQAGSAYE